MTCQHYVRSVVSESTSFGVRITCLRCAKCGMASNEIKAPCFVTRAEAEARESRRLEVGGG